MIGGSTSYFSTPPVDAGGIVLVQYSSATTADGSAAAVAQVLTNTIDVPTTITGSGNINVAIRANGFNGNAELVVPVTVNSGDTGSDVIRFRINETLSLNATVATFFIIDRSGADSILEFQNVAFNDPTAYFTVTPTTATGINASTSTITTDGALAGCTAQMPGSMIVTGIGAGVYTYTSQQDGKSYWNQSGIAPYVSSIVWYPDDGLWIIYDSEGGVVNTSASDTPLPSDASWTGSTVTASNITAGNQVLVGVSFDSAAGIDTATFVGGSAGALTLVPDSQVTNAGIRTAWYRGTAAGGETGVQFITDSAVRISIQAMEFSGLANAAATDTDTNSGTSATASLAGLSGDGLAVVIFAAANATNPFNEGTLTAGWTSLGVTGGNGVWQMSAYRIDGANAVSVGLTGSLDWASAGAVFAAA